MKNVRKAVFLLSGLLSLQILFASGWAWAQDLPSPEKVLFEEELTMAKKTVDLIIEFFVNYSFQLLGGIIVLVVGWVLSKVLARFVGRLMAKARVDVTVTKFACSAVKITVMVFAVLIALGKFGITLAPFIAGLSVVGFGASFALQGPLSNYGAGVTLIFTKPFKVGDTIEVANVMGEVRDLTLARTELITGDGTTVVVPNKHILGEIIHNYSTQKRIDVKVGVSYDSDIPRTLKVLTDIFQSEARIVKTPAPRVGISEFGDSSINILARVWCTQNDYWAALFDINKKIHERFKEENIDMPFPRRDVRLVNASSSAEVKNLKI